MNATTHRRSRPVAVTVAVIVLTVSVTIGFTRVLVGAHVDKPAVYIVLALVVAVPYLIIWFIFCGKNWARWVFLLVFGLAMCALAVSIQPLLTQPPLDIALYCVRVFLCLIAASNLLLRPSVEWFRGNKNDT